MRKLLFALITVLLIFPLASCNNANSGAASSGADSESDDYIIYPQRASGIIRDIDKIRTPPASVFTTPASENGLDGTMYKFYGEVTSLENTGAGNENYDAVIVHTNSGDVFIIDLYSAMAAEAPEGASDELAERFSMPNVGERVCVYAEYGGYSDTMNMPAAFLGGSEVLTRMFAAEIQKNSPGIPSESEEQDETQEQKESSLAMPPEFLCTVLDNGLANDFEGHSVTYKDGVMTVSVWSSGFAEAFENSTDTEKVAEVRNSFLSMGDAYQAFVNDYGQGEIKVVVNLLDDCDTNCILLSISDSAIIYDVTNE